MLPSRGRSSPRGCTVSQLVTTAWASASTFRGGDKRGGANGARIRLAPQKDWEVNQPAELAKVLKVLEGIQGEFNSAASDGRKVSLADLIVLAGCAGVEQAAKKAGHDVKVPFTPGRNDATQEQTDVESFGYLEPIADGFRNYVSSKMGKPSIAGRGPAGRQGAAADADRARDDGARRRPARTGRQRRRQQARRLHPAARNADATTSSSTCSTWAREWKPVSGSGDMFEGRDRKTGELKWTGTRVDLVFGSNSQLRALAEVYASSDANAKFVQDFVAAWHKVMNLDRFDLA